MFWDTLIDLCSRGKTSPNAVAAELKLSSGSVTAWKNGATPRATTIKKIADYFSVSPAIFYGESNNPHDGIKKDPGQMTEAVVDQELIRIWSDSDETGRKAIMDAAKLIESLRKSSG